MIHLDTVSVYYAAGPALRGISLELRHGEVTVLLGASGAGKSTLLRCMGGLVVPTTGLVLVDGLGDLADERTRRAHRRRTGTVFPSHWLIGRLTAASNILRGRLRVPWTFRSLFPASPREIRLGLHCLDRVRLLDKAKVRADQLSDGERQRVAIARALIQEPDLLLADDPVANLDPVRGELIVSLLRRICREDGLTVAMSLNQLDLARHFADRIIGLRDGRMVFDGHPRALTEERLGSLYARSSLRTPEMNEAR